MAGRSSTSAPAWRGGGDEINHERSPDLSMGVGANPS
jgi:hypothetical protein